jgi:hypothetical protein
MLKKVINLVKKAIFSICLLYGYNLIAAPLAIIVPINIVTVLAITVLGVPALLALIFIALFAF